MSAEHTSAREGRPLEGPPRSADGCMSEDFPTLRSALDRVAALEARQALVESRLDALCAALNGPAALTDTERPGSAMDVDLIRVKQAAALVGKTPDTLRNWATQHGLGTKIGGQWFIAKSKLHAFIEGRAPRA